MNKTPLKNPSSIKMRERDSYREASRENGGRMCALPSPASPPEHIMKDATRSLALFFFFVYKKEDDSLCMPVFPTRRSASCANAMREIPRRPRGELLNWRWEGKRELFSLRWHSAGLLKSFCALSRENMSLSLNVTPPLKQKDDVPCQAFQYSKRRAFTKKKNKSLDAQWGKALWSACLLVT